MVDLFQKFKLIDTAGIRRRAAVASGGSTTEALSVNRAFRAIRRSDVVALVIEALACITEQVHLRGKTFNFSCCWNLLERLKDVNLFTFRCSVYNPICFSW